jgi:AcrR family transcriptional regulator
MPGSITPIWQDGQVPRSYSSDVRRAGSARTRRAVIDAAVSVFAEKGWFGTTMPAVAERASVAVETVYRAVSGGKPALLAAAVQAALAGGAERAEVRSEERPGIRRVIDAGSPDDALRKYAAILPSTWRRAGPLLAALDTAGPDESLVRLRSELEEQRLAGMRRFAHQLEASGALRPGMTRDRVADVLWTVCSRANFDALVGTRGWSDQEYIAWVARILVTELLQPGRVQQR